MYLLGIVQNKETSQNDVDIHTQRPAMMSWFLLVFGKKHLNNILTAVVFFQDASHEKGTLKEIQSPLMKANENLL